MGFSLLSEQRERKSNGKPISLDWVLGKVRY
jgi:hypothetical protein